jgi:hypothetical protein
MILDFVSRGGKNSIIWIEQTYYKWHVEIKIWEMKMFFLHEQNILENP